MKRLKPLLAVLAVLLIGAVTVVAAHVYRPYIPQPLTVSLANMTVIQVDVDDAEWLKGIWFDWDLLYAFDFWIFVETCCEPR